MNKATSVIVCASLCLTAVVAFGVATSAAINIQSAPVETNAAEFSNIYERATTVEDGRDYIIAYPSSKTVLGESSRTSRFNMIKGVSATFQSSDSKVTVPTNAYIFTAHKTSNNKWNFVTKDNKNLVIGDGSINVNTSAASELSISISSNKATISATSGFKSVKLVHTNIIIESGFYSIASSSLFSIFSSDCTLYTAPYWGTAVEFSEMFQQNIVCDRTGNSRPTMSKTFNELNEIFMEMSESDKELLRNADYTVSGSGASTVVTAESGTNQKVAEAMYDYDYIIAKYGYNNFIGRTRNPLTFLGGNAVDNGQNIAIIVIGALIGVTALGAVAFVRKQKHN